MTNHQSPIINKFLVTSGLVIGCWLLGFAQVSAASGRIEVDTGSVLVNAIEATITFPKTMKIERIVDGSSSVVIWIEEPRVDPATNTLVLAGMTPGGFQGRRPIIWFEGEFSPSDLPFVRFSSVRALRNDDLGSETPVRLYAVSSEIAEDAELPEPFKPVLGRSPDIYDGAWFVSFLAHDKATGVDHYEAASSRLFSPKDEDFAPVESPLLLDSDNYAKKIYIRAIDRSGNAREVWIAGPSYYKMLVIWAIIISILTICALYLRRRLRSSP